MPLPEYTKFKEASLIPNSVVNEVRHLFLDDVAKTPDQYYQKDIDRIKTNDWHITRFIIEKKYNVDDALKAIITANKWRKSFGVREIKSSDFPKELYQSGGAFIYGTDLNGSKFAVIRAKVNVMSKSWKPTLYRFFVYNFEQLDQNFDGKGITTVMHCNGVGLKHINIEVLRFNTKLDREYYPGISNAFLLHELPTIIEPIFKIILSWLSDDEKNLIKITNNNNINEYIAKEQLPDFLFGTNTQSYRIVPNDAPTAVQLAKSLGLKEGMAENLVKQLEPYFTDCVKN